ncbi:hypothetical protein [Spirochaeta isovalerica]|uniref:Glycoside hydrolase family 38 N-terminal domain-containing protein n=1 Tax=Spirochaeta isovalerica TaxID=150 RepID=A0A841RB80_9SPIO|nr:hypothetical protein [Spirochaeta isovalerica]MBB6479938.1 hypothetical protein [Spirochaeta isovalerica]
MKKWKVCLIHHTHFDIGYTHTQKEVLDIQFRNQEQAMDLVDANRNRPENAQFRWNPEATWALKKWLSKAGQKQIDRFVSMVRSGHIGLDGLFANMHTALCRPEELIRMMDWKREFEKLTGTTIDSAMITDVPGWNWGMVPALSEEGIRYLSAGTNHMDRIGSTIKEWGDKPFYWVSPSGREKILLWVHGKGYAWFHTGLNKTKNLRNKLRYGRIRRYLDSLEKKNYPYDTVILRYNIGSDNGPPDPDLSAIVEDWNKAHKDIELVISTNSGAMADFEKNYGDQLPRYRGDLTAYWEDGVLSTARETAIAREASERLIQAGNLAIMTGGESGRRYEAEAWEQVLLFNEHTWGAHNSISRPDHPFARSQWDWKKQRALKGEEGVHRFLTETLGGQPESGHSYSGLLNDQSHGGSREKSLSVYNSLSWPVSRIVEISTAFNSVADEEGNPVPSQRLSNGRLAFFAASVPAFGLRSYRLSETGPAPFEGGCYIEGYRFGNDRISCEIDRDTGRISSLVLDNREYVPEKGTEGFNSFVLVPGKFPSLRKSEATGAGVSIDMVDKGPLRVSFRISRKAPRCHEFISDISIDAWSDEVRIHNVLDRPVSRRKEGLHFAFPMDIPGGVLRYDSAWGTVRLEEDQLPGANRNFISASRWVDVSGPEKGMSCVLMDAPIFKSGELVHDPVRSGPPGLCGWLDTVDYKGTVYSYVMNNYWQTNFKADQPGKTLFRYVFRPHGSYSPEENYRSSLENLQPLQVTAAEGKQIRELPRTSCEAVVISSLERRDGSLFMRLVNISDDVCDTSLLIGKNSMEASQFSLAGSGKEGNLNGNQITLVPGETVLVKIKE